MIKKNKNKHEKIAFLTKYELNKIWKKKQKT